MPAASHCPHVATCVGRLSGSDLAQLLTNPSCDVCRRSLASTNLWLCVFPDCYMMGCAETKSDHSTNHNRERPDHAIQLNVSNKRAWCYLCKAEVFLSNNVPSVQGVLGTRLQDHVEEEEEEAVSEASEAGLVGLANLGNTCYMNSTLQCLSNTPALTRLFLNCPEILSTSIKPNLGQAYTKLLGDLWQSAGQQDFVAPTGVLHAIKQAWPAFRGFQQHDAQEFLRCFMDQLHKEILFAEPASSRAGVGEEEDEEEEEDSNYESADEETAGGPQTSGRKRSRREEEAGGGPGASPKKTNKQVRSIVTDIFEGGLQSSVQCLTCNTVSRTQETFQDLSLPIPLSSERLGSKTEEGWASWAWWWLSSWFYGPDVSLADCLGCFFSADELKGDNMYRCEKCKMLRNGLKYSQLTRLPDTLCIHLKRFRHDYSYSSKISTRVTFPLSGLDMSGWQLTRQAGHSHTFSLAGVICHHGVSGVGGHYTCYCYNTNTNQWFHYDDSSVRPVDASTVASAEAYVLFYHKDPPAELEQARLKVRHGLKQPSDSSQTVLTSYIATVWLAKFFTVSDPGPVDNSSVICRHGSVLPCRAASLASLVTPIPSQVWRLLHSTYGGSAAITNLQVCARCQEQERLQARQKDFELQQFKLLHEEDRNHETDRYCVAASWFRDWEGWVCNKAKDPPGPINNKSLVLNRQTGPTLRSNVDHYKFSEDIWHFLLFHYGGGPEVLLPSEGGVRVSQPDSQYLETVREKVRLIRERNNEMHLED